MKPRTQKLLLTLGRVSLFLVLLLLPTALRAGFYYRRIYAPQAVPRPELGAVDVPTVALEAPADRDVRQGRGRIVIDRAHENTLDDADLNVLLARLTARSIETVSLLPGDPLSDALRDAIALVVIAPHLPFQVWEIEAVQRFVEQGGRVLLIADPSRYSFRYEYDDYYGEYAVPESDVASINSLAAAFGLSFADDYIYNTAENAGNFQYVVLQDFASHPLTAGLEQVIFYAAHSIATGEQAVVTADEHTSSSLSEQTGGLVTVSLDGNSQVLAVADFTFMTEPYNGSADNNRLVANIADFLVGAERVYTLTDFPHFFGDEVHLVPLMGLSQDDALAVDAIEQANSLQSTFEAAGKRLYWRAQPQAGHDTLFLGLYGGVDFAAEPGQILASRGISFTLETIERARATPTPTPRRTPTPTPTADTSPTPTPTEKPLRDWLRIEGMGQIDAKEVALFFHNQEAGREVLMVLAFAEDGLSAAVQRLIFDDFTRCVVHQDRADDPDAISLALCPTAYEPSEEGPTPTPTATPVEEAPATPTPAATGDMLIVSDDDGAGVYDWWTSAYIWQDIAFQVGYSAIVWSTYLDGAVTLEQMQSYDAVIWCTGDYQKDGVMPAQEDLFNIAEYLAGGGRVILTGAFIGFDEQTESGLLVDMQVSQTDHPLTEGFEADQVITLERLTADEDYRAYVMEDADPETVFFTRGPASEFPDAPLITAEEDEFFGSRTIIIGLPVYLMPWEAQTQLGTNTILWLMEGLGG